MRCLSLTVVAFALASQFTIGLASATAADSIGDLRKQKLAWAEKWYTAITVAYEAGTVELKNVYAASVGLKNASYELATDKPHRVAALQAHRDRMDSLSQKIDALAAVMAKGGEGEKVAPAHFWLAEAKIWLLEEKAKP